LQHSAPGKKLNPLISAHTARIYAVNPVRYKSICRFVWHYQKAGWPDEAIAGAFELAGESIHMADNWWAYCAKLLPKAKGRASEQESQLHKTEFGQIAGEFVEFLRQRQAR